jgi:hypothetical protein
MADSTEDDHLILPQWSANSRQDTLKANDWVKYVDLAQEMFNWNDEHTMSCVQNALTGPALGWFNSLVKTFLFSLLG